MARGAARRYLRELPRVLGVVFGNPALRRVQLAFAGFNTAEWGVWIAMIVYAYGRGGATEAGLVALVQLVPAALFAPVASSFGDRFRPGRVLCAGYVAQAAGMGLTAVVLLGGGAAWAAYASAAVAATAVTVTRPTQSALVPSLARTPDELTASNVVSGWIESLTVLVGPVLTGVILGLAGPGWVFAVMAGVALVSAALVAPVAGPPPAERVADAPTNVRRALGLLRHERELRVLVALLATEFVAVGALDVLYAELAIGVLERPESWAAYLNAAYGLGGTLGIAAAAALVGRRRLVPALLAGLGAWLVAFLVLGAAPTLGVAVLMLAAAGTAHVVFDVAGRTLLQRVAPNDLLSSVFGLLEGLSMAGLAVGSLLAPALIALGGVELAFVGVGLLLPLVALLAGRRGLLGIDGRADVPVVEIGLLRRLPLFAALPAPTLESLARSLVAVTAPAGTEVIRQGEPGDRFYVVADGRVEVVRDGVAVDTIERGGGFGEIALLHGVPRTATIRALEATSLYALEQDDFLPAVTGHPGSAEEARRLVESRSARA